MASSSSSDAIESILKTLISRGWCFKDVNEVKDLIAAQLFSRSNSCSVDSIVSKLINLDLRSIGGKSLPEPSRLRKLSQLQGPKVLQIASARDISRSNMAESSGNSSKRRLLRLILTDGQSEIIAIEYSPILSFPDDVVPGTKVCVENKAIVNSGIVCLNAKITTVLGGCVQSLHEEWEMNHKYSGLSRSSLQPSRESGTSRPPPFEKLQVGASLQPQRRSSQHLKSSSSSTGLSVAATGESSMPRKTSELQSHVMKVDSRKTDVQPPASVDDTKESPTNSDARPKEVAEAVPVQNQAAAQKLLQKMVPATQGGQNCRGRRHKGRGKEEEPAVLTLDEWERRKAGINTSSTLNFPDVSRDEELARELQEKFNLENIHVQSNPNLSEAENIRMSMFTLQRDDAGGPRRSGFRGRGKGRGRRGRPRV